MFRRVRGLLVVLLSFAASFQVQPAQVRACPFCSAVSQTFSEEMNSMDVVLIGELVKTPSLPKLGAAGQGEELSKAQFKVVKVLRGAATLGKQKTVECVYFGDAKPGQRFLMMGVDPPKLMWSTPLALTRRAETYIPALLKLPALGSRRLVFFQDYLEDADEMLARDAYDEFAKAPYATLTGIKKKMKHGKLIAWIHDPDVPASRRRLYLTMLGVCGDAKDLPLLETMLRSPDRKSKAGLDALISCYLLLRGVNGMPLIEDLYLKNNEAEYADTYAAIMALRFHGSGNVNVIPKKRIVQGLRHMLERPQLADLVIPDLARWEDWESMPRLVKLFKNADEKSSWVRVPVINYLRACPLPEAKEKIKELEKIDPDAVKRANTFFPFKPATKQQPKAQETSKIEATVQPVVSSLRPNAGKAVATTHAVGAPRRRGIQRGDVPLFAFLGGPLLLGAVLMMLYWRILSGAGTKVSWLDK